MNITNNYLVILQLHRSYFIRALSSSRPFTLQHEYAPSVIAIFNSAVRTINGLKTMMHHRPRSTKRVYVFWFNVFSSIVRRPILGTLLGNKLIVVVQVALSFIVSRCPLIPFAEAAVEAMRSAIPIYRELAIDNARGSEALVGSTTVVEGSQYSHDHR